MLAVYSSLLVAVLVVGAPYWLFRTATSGRYRVGLWGRLGRVPEALKTALAGREVVWVHAVSVGEVMAATRLVGELEAALPGWLVVVSTTTATGQALARERFGSLAGADSRGAGSFQSARVFFYPLDLGWVVRRYLRALQPRLLVLLESEVWPRMLAECGRAGVPVAVVNARVSDRSFARGLKVRAVWGRVLAGVSLFAAQSTEDARRLVELGAQPERVRVAGNLKYDVRLPGRNRVADWVLELAAGRPVVVAGSTVKVDEVSEEEMVIRAWQAGAGDALLVMAVRHPERFAEVEKMVRRFHVAKVSGLAAGPGAGPRALAESVEVVLVDTIGDLAAVYGVADVAFVGGSLVRRGGHNPLEPAQFGVPVVMGPSYENFRSVVEEMQAVGGIRVVRDAEGLAEALRELLANRAAARAFGERGREAFAAQAGATGRTVEMLMELLHERATLQDGAAERAERR